MELLDIVKTLARRKWLLIIVPFLTAMVVFFAVRSLPRTYKSRSQIATGITESQGGISLSEEREFIQPFIIDNRFANLIEMTKSKLVMDKVSASLLLHDLTNKKPFRTPEKERLAKVKFERRKMIAFLEAKLRTPEPVYGSGEQEREYKRLLEVFGYDIISINNILKAERIPDADFLKFDFESENPELSAKVVNLVAEKLMAYHTHIKSYRSNNSVDYFASLVKDKKKDLDGKVDTLKRYKMKQQVINFEEETKNLIEQIKNLEERLQEEREKVPALQASINEIERKFSPGERRYLEDQAGEFNRKMLAYQNRIGKLNNRLVTNYFNNPRLEDSISSMRRMFELEVRRSADDFLLNPNATKQELVVKKVNNELDLRMSQSNIVSINREVQRLKALTAKYGPIEAELNAYERDISVAKDAYLLVLNKLNMAQSESMNIYSNLRIVELGSIAESPESQKLAVTLALGIIVSLLVIMIIIFFIEYFDQRVKSASRFRKSTGLPVLSSVNLLPIGNLDLRQAFNQTENPDEVTLFKAYLRHIRNIFIEDGSKVFLFTGFNGKEGKSTLITSLSFSLALLNKKVLIIDANFRHNSITSMFFAKQELEKDGQLTEDSVSPTDLPNVEVLGTKIQAMSPAEIVNTNGFENFMAMARAKYDFILIETASLEKNFDAEELLPYCDKVIAIFAASEPIRSDDKARFNFFHQLNNKFMGAILNQVQREFLEDIVSQQSKKSFKWFGRNNNQQAAASVVM